MHYVSEADAVLKENALPGVKIKGLAMLSKEWVSYDGAVLVSQGDGTFAAYFKLVYRPERRQRDRRQK